MPSVGKKEQRILNRIARKKIKDATNLQEFVQAGQDIKEIPNGRPALYNTPEEMEAVIAEYIEREEKAGKMLTITGLALALGMDRRNLLEYSKKDNFFPIINKYRQVLLNQVEQALTDKSKFTPGQIFYLKNNYKQDYQDKIEVENKHSGSISLLELSRLADTIDERDVIEGELIDEPPIEDNAS